LFTQQGGFNTPTFHLSRLPRRRAPKYATVLQESILDFDFSKIAGEFKMPTMNIESIVETGRKNFAVMTAVNTSAVESMKAIAQRQGDMVRAAMEDFSKHGSDVMSAATVERRPPSRSTS
jgi:hypothetical protein